MKIKTPMKKKTYSDDWYQSMYRAVWNKVNNSELKELGLQNILCLREQLDCDFYGLTDFNKKELNKWQKIHYWLL
jgi:hypothetical protein